MVNLENPSTPKSVICTALILALSSGSVGILLAIEIWVDPGTMGDNILFLSGIITLPPNDTIVVNIFVIVVIAIVLFPLLHALCIRWHAFLLRGTNL